MVFEHIEKLKSEFTDKYVVVDKNRPELRRFSGQTGIVRTVNMSGRALVEFDAYDNIGWYDIDVDYLKIIEAPLPKEEKPAAPAKSKVAAPKKKAVTSAPAAKGGGMSVADMLAAARGGKAGAAAAPSKPAAKPKPQGSPAGGDPRKMSVEEMLAAARGKKTDAAATAPPSEPEPAEPEPATEESAPAKEPPSPAPAAGPLPTDPEAIVAWCRQRDA